MSNRKTKVAVIGAGRIATTAHIPAYLSNKHVDLVALVDPDRKKVEKTAKKFGVKQFFVSADELFEKQDVNAVSICTPPNTHEEVALKAIGHGVHVLCEKPLATSVDGGKRMVEASKTNQKILSVGFNRRFWPNYQRAKKYISEGSLGHIYCAVDHYVQSNPLVRWGKSPWFYSPEEGGVLLDLGPHVFDMFNYIFGDFPYAISARSSTHLDSLVEEFCACVLEYPEERIGIGVLSWLSPKYIENLNIYGTAGNLYVSPKFFLEANPTYILEVSLWREASKSLVGLKFPNLPMLRTKKVNTFQLEINYFIEQIEKNAKFSSNALSALNVLIACDAAKKSLKEDRRIEISSIKQL